MAQLTRLNGLGLRNTLLASFLKKNTGTSVALALRKLSKSSTDVSRVIRSSDDAEQDFNATEVKGSELLDYVVAADIQALYNNSVYFQRSDNSVSVDVTRFSSDIKAVSVKITHTDALNGSIFFDSVGGASIEVFTEDGQLRLYSSGYRIFTFGSGAIDWANQLNSIVVQQEADTNYYAYVNGEKSTNSFTTAQMSGVRFNEIIRSTASITGTAVEYGAYDSPLSQGEVDSLVSGSLPSTISSVVHEYLGKGITASDWEDTVGTNDATINGSPALFTGQGFDGAVSTWYDQRVPTSITTKATRFDTPETSYYDCDTVTIGSSKTWEAEVDMIIEEFTNYVFPFGYNQWSTGVGLIIYADGKGRCFSKGSGDPQIDLGITLGQEETIKYGYDGSDVFVDVNGVRKYTTSIDQSGTLTDVSIFLGGGGSLTDNPCIISRAKLTIDGSVVRNYENIDGSSTITDSTNTQDATLIGSGVTVFRIDMNDNLSKDATQTTAANQPLIIENGALVTENTRPILSFDGNDDVLRTPADEFITPTTKLQASIVLKNDNSTLSGGRQTIVGQYDIGIDERAFAMEIFTDDGIQIAFGNESDGTFLGIWESVSPITPDDLQVIGFTYDSGTVKIYINSVEISSQLSSGSIPSSLYNSAADFTIACKLDSDSPSDLWDGKIGEVYIADNLTDDIVEVQQNMMRYYNIE